MNACVVSVIRFLVLAGPLSAVWVPYGTQFHLHYFPPSEGRVLKGLLLDGHQTQNAEHHRGLLKVYLEGAASETIIEAPTESGIFKLLLGSGEAFSPNLPLCHVQIPGGGHLYHWETDLDHFQVVVDDYSMFFPIADNDSMVKQGDILGILQEGDEHDNIIAPFDGKLTFNVADVGQHLLPRHTSVKLEFSGHLDFGSGSLDYESKNTTSESSNDEPTNFSLESSDDAYINAPTGEPPADVNVESKSSDDN